MSVKAKPLRSSKMSRNLSRHSGKWYLQSIYFVVSLVTTFVNELSVSVVLGIMPEIIKLHPPS